VRYVCCANERTTDGCPYKQTLINTVGASIARPLDFDDFLREDDILPYEQTLIFQQKLKTTSQGRASLVRLNLMKL